jgi:OOP family OmpA-OmpF porin
MRQLVFITMAAALAACASTRSATPDSAEPEGPAEPTAASGAETGGPEEAAPETATESDSEEPKEFVIRDSDGASSAQRAKPSKIKPTATAAALKFFVIDQDKGPIGGIVISLTGPDGKKYYTEETDADGYAELLVPVGQRYDVVYLSLGRRDVAARVTVTSEPRQNIRLTLRYKRIDALPSETGERFVLEGIYFDTGKATIRPESFTRLDSVVEYMTYKPSARIEISGHSDNVGNPKKNKALAEKRAQACREYLISKGVDGERISAVGYGDERPIASNDTEEGRQQNRRIEATEL